MAPYPPCRCDVPTPHSLFGASHCGRCGGPVPLIHDRVFRPIPDIPVTTILRKPDRTDYPDPERR